MNFLDIKVFPLDIKVSPLDIKMSRGNISVSSFFIFKKALFIITLRLTPSEAIAAMISFFLILPFNK